MLVMSVLVSGCIGVDPDAKKTETPAATPAAPAAPAAPATPAKPAASTTTADGKPIQFQFRSNSFPSTLRSHYEGFARSNTSLEKRNQIASEGNFASIFKLIDLWSNKSFWKYEDGRKLNDVPPAGAIAAIKTQGSPSLVQIDAAYTLEQLTLDASSGIYVPKDGALLAQTLKFQNSSFALVPEGRIGGQDLEMQNGSFIDLVGGNGCIIDAELKDLKVEESNPKGVMTFGENGSVSINSAIITAHKVEQLGDIKLSKAVFNLQHVVAGNMTNIEYLHKKGKIQQLPEKPEFFFKVNGLYKLKADAEIEMLVYGESPFATPIQLVHLPDLPVTSAPTEDDKPSIEGKILLTPYGELEKQEGITLINSDVEFSQTTINNVSRLLHEASKKINNYTFALKMSDNKKQILLDIKLASSLAQLKASMPVQHAAASFRQGVFKASLSEGADTHVKRVIVGAIELFAAQESCSSGFTSTHMSLFGLKHKITTGLGQVDLQQSWGRARVFDYVYRYVPESHQPFWMVQHRVRCSVPFNVGCINMTPSAGLSHQYIPETAFQEGFHTVIPSLGVTCGFQHTVDASKLSVNFSLNAEYQQGRVQLSDQVWGMNTGVSMKLQLPTLAVAVVVVDPFQTAAEVCLNICLND